MYQARSPTVISGDTRISAGAQAPSPGPYTETKMRGPGGTVLGHWSRRRKTLSWVDPQQRARTPVTAFKGVGTEHPGKEHKARVGRSPRIGTPIGWQSSQGQGQRPGPSAGHTQELHREQSGPETYTHSKQPHRTARHPVTAAVGVDGGIRNVRAARGCSAVLSSSAVRLCWRANAVRGKHRDRSSPGDRWPTIPRSDTSV